MSRRIAWLVAAGGVSLAAPATAQSIAWVPHTGHYGAVGGGRHGLTLDCDSLCPSGTLSTGAFEIALGRQITHRVRIEFAGSIGTNSERRSTFLSAGVAAYLVSGLYVRGGATLSQLDITDSASASFTHRGGPGFLVGGGFDIPVGRTFALTPFANYVAGKATTVDVGGAAPAATTSGNYHSVNFGVSLTRLAGMYRCTNRAGERIWVRRRDRVRALLCIAEVESTLAGRRTGIKL